MKGRMLAARAAAVAGFAMAAACPARADVLSVVLEAPLATAPVTVALAGTGNSFAFTQADTGGNGPGAALATAGTGQATSLLGGLTDFEAGATIDQSGELYSFSGLPTATLIPNSAADDFVGLAFTLTDGIHYGYAEVFGPELVGYAYQTTPNASITTTPVPEPASLTLLGAGVLGLGMVQRRRNIAA